MSNFNCPKCGTPCLDTRYGYITGCRHHPADADREHMFSIITEMHGKIASDKVLIDDAHDKLIQARDLLQGMQEHFKGWPASGGM